MRHRLHIDAFDRGLAAAVAAAFLAIARLPIAPPKFGDEYFHQEAQWLALFLQGKGPWKDVVITRAPGPDLYYALAYLFVPPGSPENAYWLAAITWNALWMIVATLLLRRAGEVLAGPLAGKLAASLSLVAPFIVYYSCGVSAEPPTYLGAVIFAYGWAKRRASSSAGRYTWISLGGLILLVLSRPNVALLSGLLLAVAAGLWWKGTAFDLREAKFAILCAFVAAGSLLTASELLALLPKKLGTSQQQKNFSDVMFFGSFQCRTELFDWRFWGKKTKTGSADYEHWSSEHDRLIEESKSGPTLPSLELNWAVDDIIHHPLLRIRMTAVRLLMLNVAILNSERVEPFGAKPLSGKLLFIAAHILVNAIGFLPLIGALLFLVRSRDQLLLYWALWTPWLTLLLFHAFVYAEPRYMLSSRPLLSLMASVAVLEWVRRESNTRQVTVMPQHCLQTRGTPQREAQILSVTRNSTAEG